MQQSFKTIYYTQLAKIEENIPFFDWLNDFLPNHQISIPNYNKCYYATKWKLWHNLLAKETTVSIQPSSSFPKQEIQNIFENPRLKERLCTDTLSCSIQTESLESKSSLSDNSNLSQTTKDNSNKIQLEENCLLKSIKVKEIALINSPPLFNPLHVPIKETPSIPSKNFKNNNKKERSYQTIPSEKKKIFKKISRTKKI